ncbi:formylglycine-generating enzyme family protein [Zooshikella harenae]|uniref:SUMF1/EgtB/PvdO family nonheme iron enzyme n=1 Tax=Zooshikella harenae TaxID=2827238 RepID=A0ABS5ZJW1_9GAMM|nr:SUMF1/EgtB/PvdO family nonheme iron enzyme [Zooshikella harenae]MBU2714230.1 SUMF1/EgtB/PvdO family nonheme iron enzyme [Zooshikella harenae]
MFKKQILILTCCIPFFTACISEEAAQAELNEFVSKTMANMIDIKGGAFKRMTAEDYMNREYSKPKLYETVITDFAIGKYEVTCAEFAFFLKSSGHKAPQFKKEANCIIDRTPAHYVSWYDAKAYCEWLGTVSNKSISLPTEAQWEYVARNLGQKGVLFATNNGKREPGKNTDGYETSHGSFTPTVVDKYPPTPLGVYALEGGVSEWVLDSWTRNYDKLAIQNPVNLVDDEDNTKTNRGHSFRSSGGNKVFPTTIRRDPESADSEIPDIGFRCAINK